MHAMADKPHAAPSAGALEQSQQRLRFESHCWGVHDALSHDLHDFVLFVARAEQVAAKG